MMLFMKNAIAAVTGVGAIVGLSLVGGSASAYEPTQQSVYVAQNPSSCNKSPCILYPKSTELTSGRLVGKMLMGYWHGLEAALEPMGTWILHEVNVARHQVAALIYKAEKVSAETDFFVSIHGHALDGTLHPMIVFNPNSPERRTGLARFMNGSCEPHLISAAPSRASMESVG